MWGSILAIPSALGWYFDHWPSVHSSVPSWFGGASLTLLIFFGIIALGSHAVISYRLDQTRARQQAQGGSTAASGPAATSTQSNAATSTSTTQYKNVDEFYKTYSGRMLNETEDLVRKESDQYQQGIDRERYLIRLAAVLTTLLIFERAWLMIYGSQLKLLQNLNIGGIKSYDQVRTHYDQAAKANPDYYKSLSFDAWVGWLKSWLLIRDYDAAHVEITVRGQDFLRYLLEARYDPALRLG
jgi:hypothetical protein